MSFGTANVDISRCIRVVNAIVSLTTHPTLTEEEQEAVIRIIEREGLTMDEFVLLDEKPGTPAWGGYRNGTWHWKLRQVRNSHNRLFEVLEANSRK